jgi:PilZ domain
MSGRPPSSSAEQRSALRLPAQRVPSIDGVRISPGDVPATLVNISMSGLLVECTSKPRPGSAITVQFSGTFQPAVVRGRVARTMVASLGKDGVLHYMVGIAFDNAIDLEQYLSAAGEAPPPVASQAAETAPKVVSRLQNRW